MKKYYGYYPLIDIYTYTTLIQLKNYLDGIHHRVTVVGNCISDSNFTFAIPLTKDNFWYYCINENERKLLKGYKGVLKAIMFFTKMNTRSVVQKWKFITCVWIYKYDIKIILDKFHNKKLKTIT